MKPLWHSILPFTERAKNKQAWADHDAAKTLNLKEEDIIMEEVQHFDPNAGVMPVGEGEAPTIKQRLTDLSNDIKVRREALEANYIADRFKLDALKAELEAKIAEIG